MENNFLNDKNNLNLSMEAIKSVVTGNQAPKELTPEKKEEVIEKWNETPIVKKNNIRAIDIDKERAISNGKLSTLKVLSIAGIIFLLTLAAVAGVFGYIVYKDGSLKSSVSLICGNVSVNIPPCPEVPSCGDCKLDCGNVTFKPEINIYPNSS